MNDLPTGWVSVRLGDLLTNIVGGGTPSKANASYFQGTIPFMTVKDMHSRFIEDTQDHITQEALADSASTLIPADTLVVASRMALGKIARPKIATAINQDLKALFLHQEIHKTYVEYAWRANESLIQAMGTGTTVKGIRLEDIRGLELSLAPSAEQTRIASQLDKLLARIQACQGSLDSIPALLKRFRQAVIRAATSGDLTKEIRTEQHWPEKWESQPLATLGELGRGKSKHRPRNDSRLYGGGYPFVQTGDVAQSGGLIKKHRQTYSEFGLQQSRLWPAGTLCITIAANIADTAILTYPACFPDSVVGFIANPAKCLGEFVKWCIDAIKDDLESFAPATAQKNINLAVLNDVLIRCPSLDEQAEIVRQVHKYLAIAERIEACYFASATQIHRLPLLTLAKAFRGELVQQNPQDEPASSLLQRIAGKPPEKLKTTRGRPRIKKPETVDVLPVALPDWSTLPAGAWAAQVPTDEHTATAQLTAVLKAWNKPMPQDTARLATLLCLQPRLLTAALPADHAAQWSRLVGDAAAPLPAQVVTLQPAFNTPWRNAISKMRAREDLVESGSGVRGTWALGPDAGRVDTTGWPDGRAGWVVHYLQTHGVEAVLPTLATEVQEFVHARAA